MSHVPTEHYGIYYEAFELSLWIGYWYDCKRE